MAFDTVQGKYLTSDSRFLSDDIKAIAALIEGRITTTWDLFRPMAPSDSVTITWYDSMSNSLQGAVGVGGWNNSDTTGLVVSSATSAIINVGDVCLIESEQVIVSSVDRSGNTIDVQQRGHGSTSAATHTADKVIYIIGSANVEGTVDGDSIIEDNEEKTNYFQLLEEPLSWSKQAQEQMYKDMTDLKTDARKKAMSRALRKLNLTALFGVPVARTSTKSGTAGGLDHFITNATNGNTSNVGGALTESSLKTLISMIDEDGGSPDTIICSPSDKATINTFNLAANATAATRTYTTRGDRTAGNIVDLYDTEGLGTLRVVSDPLLTSS